MSINSCIEDFSNEIFYEIFDYLNGIDIYNGFSNLNYRFEQFIHNPSFLFNIRLSTSSNERFINEWQSVSAINKHQILSFSVYSPSDMDEYLSIYLIDSSFHRLQSISLYFYEEDILISVLQNLIYLPELLSLNIRVYDELDDLSDIYQLIFTLSTLKSVKVSTIECIWLDSLSLASKNQQLSSIEYLNIDHCCTFDQLAILTSYTPQLNHLKFEQELDDDDDELSIDMILSIPFDHLTHLSLDVKLLDYDDFLIFIKKICSKLIVFNLIVRNDSILYLASILWERLISQYMPQLRKFSLKFHEIIDDEDDGSYLWPDDQFLSSFWIERKWIFHVAMDDFEIIYSVYPYKKSWYDSVEIDLNSMISNEENLISTSSKLTIEKLDFSECVKSLAENLCWIKATTPVYHLELPKEQISIPALLDIIKFLPDLQSLQFWSLLLTKTKRLSAKEIKFRNDIKNYNRITKIYIEHLMNIKEVFDLIDLFPRMKYLQINWPNYINIESFIGINLIRILKKASDEFCSLSFIIKRADDQVVNKLKDIIDSKRLLCNYTIKRVSQTIYLKWK